MEVLVSVIIPVYNVENYLRECLNSVIDQSYSNMEILLIDDGSTDNSGKVCDEYAQKDKRIKVIHKENGGVSSARNLGLDIAQGEYIAFIDSDDRVHETYIEKLYKKIRAEKADVCLCHFSQLINEKLKKIKEPLPNSINIDLKKKETISFFEKYFSCKGIGGCIWRSLYRAKIVKHYRFSCSLARAEDLLFNLEVLVNCKKVVSLNEWLYEYRINEKSQMSSYNKKLLNNNVETYRQVIRIISIFNSRKLWKKANRFFCLLCLLCFTNELKGRIKYKTPKNDFKIKIKEIQGSELYKYFTLIKGVGIDKLKIKLEFLVVWFLVKTRLV